MSVSPELYLHLHPAFSFLNISFLNDHKEKKKFVSLSSHSLSYNLSTYLPKFNWIDCYFTCTCRTQNPVMHCHKASKREKYCEAISLHHTKKIESCVIYVIYYATPWTTKKKFTRCVLIKKNYIMQVCPSLQTFLPDIKACYESIYWIWLKFPIIK